jgi:hypothetical protein
VRSFPGTVLRSVNGARKTHTRIATNRIAVTRYPMLLHLPPMQGHGTSPAVENGPAPRLGSRSGIGQWRRHGGWLLPPDDRAPLWSPL